MDFFYQQTMPQYHLGGPILILTKLYEKMLDSCECMINFGEVLLNTELSKVNDCAYLKVLAHYILHNCWKQIRGIFPFSNHL